MNKVDVIVPVKNEAQNIFELVKRIHVSLASKYEYRIIFVDDLSEDNTASMVSALKQFYPIILLTKKGRQGKAYSILEASSVSDRKMLVMIDGDLQYPPEAIPEMLQKLEDENTGVVVANRSGKKTSILRRLGSAMNKLIFEKLLHGFDCDTQSGLKAFRHEVIDLLSENDVKEWTIDMPILKACLASGYKIDTIKISFSPRKAGISKIDFIKAGKQIAGESIKLKLRGNKAYKFDSIDGQGYFFNGKKYITHSALDPELSAVKTFTPIQKLVLTFFGFTFVIGLIFFTKVTLTLLIGILSYIYLSDFLFTGVTIFRSLKKSKEISISPSQIADIDDSKLPVYTILCPLYKEAEVIKQFVSGIESIDWPKDKLEVLLLLEEDDTVTINKAYDLKLPPYYKILIVPASLPKTKPKACNFGLNQATGDYLVIYDAEDKPDPLQLKKAFLAFRQVDRNTICLQSKLNYYNQDQNLLTKLFTSEYSFWFDIALPGLQSFDTFIPLGGTSNHFKTEVLKSLNGWDAFNVTEDCDLGTRLFKKGYKSAIIDSVTFEEANSKIKSWIRQRSRWIKGYMQTYFVHMRKPVEFFREFKLHAVLFQLIIAMRMVFILINPFLWLMTLAYFTLYRFVGPQIQALYPPYIFYIAVFTMVFGNFTYFYSNMIGLAKRNYWNLIQYVFFIPFYWMLSFVAAFIAFYQLIAKPYYWEKTKHGLHLQAENKVKVAFIPEITIIPTFEFPKINISFAYLKNLIPNVNVLTFNKKPTEKILYDSKSDSHEFTSYSAVKNRLSPINIFGKVNTLLFGGGLLIVSNIIANILNYIYNAYLGRVLTYSEFGSASLMTNAYLIISVVTATLLITVSYKAAYLLGRRGGIRKDYWSKYRKYAFLILLPVGIIWAIGSLFLSEKGLYDNDLALFVVAPTLIISAITAVDQGFLSGNHKFNMLAAITIIVPIIKLLGAFVSVTLGNVNLIYYNQPFSLFMSLLIGWFIVSKIPENKIRRGVKVKADFPFKFYLTTLLNRFTVAFFLSADVVLATFLLDPESAGKYAILSLCGKMIFFLGSLFPSFVTPVVARKIGEGKDSLKTFYAIFGLTFGVIVISYIGLGVFSTLSAPFLFGNKAYQIIEYLPHYALAIAAFTLATTIVSYHQVKKQYSFSLLGFLISAFEVLYIIQNHDTIGQIVSSIYAASLSYFVSTFALHILTVKMTSLRINLVSLLYLLKPLNVSHSDNRLNILILNWRDIKHRWAGGAEVYVNELAKKWVKKGYGVTIFCGNDGKNKFDEKLKGVNIIRRGGFFTLYAWVPIYYILKMRGKFDFVVDCENGIPFYSPLFSNLPKVLLIHHVHQAIFRKHLIFPFSYFASFLEGKLMPNVYRNVEVVTVSESSKNDILKENMTLGENINVINPGINLRDFSRMKKYEVPTYSYLGRVMDYKNVDIAIKAFRDVVKDIPNAKFIVAGRGESEEKLKLLTEKLGLQENIEFKGFVSEKEKREILARSWAMIQPSSFEGWGITVVEANASGTPVIASDTNGLRDSVADGLTGLLVPLENSDILAKAIVGLTTMDGYRKILSKNAYEWSRNYSWVVQSERFLNILMNIHEHKITQAAPAFATEKE